MRRHTRWKQRWALKQSQQSNAIPRWHQTERRRGRNTENQYRNQLNKFTFEEKVVAIVGDMVRTVATDVLQSDVNELSAMCLNRT